MSYDRANYRCEHCGQRFMSNDIKNTHERYCEEHENE